jgi:hypothetical protein
MRNEYDFTNPRKTPYASVLNKNKKLKPIPNFKDEASEKRFWEYPKTDTTEYFDMSITTTVNFSNLKPTEKL